MTTAVASHEKTPLEERLIALIRANGPISVADYMEDALLHPHDGYYTSGTPIGADGDFTTAPEVSQIFGELIGLWLVQSWIDIGSPEAFNLIELGPGRGVLMQDVLRATALRPDFLKAAHIWLVECSGRLRHEQQKRLRDVAPPVDWADKFADTPEGPALIIANELFDCLPIRQFIRTETSWRERMVGLSPDGHRLAFAEAKIPPMPDIPLPDVEATNVGDIFEYNERAEALAEEIAMRFVAQRGRALIIDYGHYESGCGDTLQAVRRHKYWPALVAPGSADLTAHVNFERLLRAAFNAGAAAFGPVAQGVFLDRLGLAMRVERLTAGKSEGEAKSIQDGAFRIAASSQMGEIFKAACFSSPGLPTPAGFDAP